VTLRTCVLETRRFDHHEAGRLVLQLLGDRLAHPHLRVSARAVLLGIRHIDVDPASRQMGRQRAAARRAPTLMAAHGRVTRIHLDRLGHGAGLVRQLLQRERQLLGIDLLRLLAKQPPAQDVELMAERHQFALRLRELFLKRENEGARGGQIVDVGLGRARGIHCVMIRVAPGRRFTPRLAQPGRCTSGVDGSRRYRCPRATGGDRHCASPPAWGWCRRARQTCLAPAVCRESKTRRDPVVSNNSIDGVESHA
jgi:hypothetical protein